MNKEALEAFAPKGIKTVQYLNEFRQVLTKEPVERVLITEDYLR